MATDGKVILQVHCSVFGQAGVDRFIRHNHPKVDGVQWLVSIQDPEGTVTIPEEMAKRDDTVVIVSRDRGLARNRNHALDCDSASDYILLGDDDTDYTAEGLTALIHAFRDNADADIICCRYTNRGEFVKNYGDGQPFDITKSPFGWYPSAIEIAFRRNSRGNVRFNEKIGIGSGILIAGEDTIFVRDMLKKGLKGIGLPITICSHDQESTGERLRTDPEFLKSHGACMTHLKPWTWFPRLLLHAKRTPMPFFKCLRHTLNGAWLAYSKGIFRN